MKPPFVAMLRRLIRACAWVALGLLPLTAASSESTVLKFQFAPGEPAPGYIRVSPADTYSNAKGYGFDLGSTAREVGWHDANPLRAGCCTAERPFFFSVALPEGNYRVTIVFGHKHLASTNTVKAESRRLMLENVVTRPGEFLTRTFTVNIRTPQIAGDGEVRLKDREKGPPPVLHWDEKLTLEFNGLNPCVCALEIAKADDVVTVYLAGDSTVTDQPKEPWNSWGQMLPRFFKPCVAIANHAESGESLRSFVRERRLDKILSTIRTNDYLLIQFGHNDMKERGPGIGPFTSFKADLKRFIAEARMRGAVPVLITPMHRKTFDTNGVVTNSFGEYPEAVRQTAVEENVPLIDLHKMSKTLYEALGPEKVNQAFVDGSHHTSYGSYLLAKCVIEGIRSSRLPLAEFIAEDVPRFNPAVPDRFETFLVQPSPGSISLPPDGS
ncbi:MAG: rhamnogalacturonan acetylesterase [Verrucomicrobiae bacterium]|nr:rhamnogalacturonan acetylesterase [Verrucomicrobiae bacterium]MCX7722987.1 rhamnogalacturonan acetylesterase [Verrucomicrobiae bacterium]MDW7980761.1 rhamnogalacturonan acetylesterase [Verrucomicrobiales bacterium]